LTVASAPPGAERLRCGPDWTVIGGKSRAKVVGGPNRFDHAAGGIAKAGTSTP